jgi:hypothetical protein
MQPLYTEIHAGKQIAYNDRSYCMRVALWANLAQIAPNRFMRTYFAKISMKTPILRGKTLIF